jgi:hypothetical protein
MAEEAGKTAAVGRTKAAGKSTAVDRAPADGTQKEQR